MTSADFANVPSQVVRHRRLLLGGLAALLGYTLFRKGDLP